MTSYVKYFSYSSIHNGCQAISISNNEAQMLYIETYKVTKKKTLLLVCVLELQ